MERYACCGHDFGTAQAYRDHRKQIHGETDVEITQQASIWQRFLALLRIRA